MRFLLRALGFLCLAAAFAAVVVDGTRSIAGGQVLAFSLGETLNWLKPNWLVLVDQAIERNRIEGGRAVLTVLLEVPTFAVVLAVGLLLLLIGRRPRRMIGYSGRD